MRRLFGHRASEGDPGRLDRFFAEEELDNLAGWTFETTTKGEAVRVRNVVSAWGPRRALFNLLLHPEMLPPEARFWVPMHAARQQEDPWIALAGIVGIGELGQAIPDAAWGQMCLLLVGVMTRTDDELLRNRITVALVSGARNGDGTVLLAAARTGQDARNLLAGILRIGDDAVALRILPAVLAHGELDPGSKAWGPAGAPLLARFSVPLWRGGPASRTVGRSMPFAGNCVARGAARSCG